MITVISLGILNALTDADRTWRMVVYFIPYNCESFSSFENLEELSAAV
jgi:hypothetical protein